MIAPEPLINVVPIQQKGEGAEVVTQYEMYGVESLGLLKMDFLGLRNLSIIERCLELVEAGTGERLDIDAVPLDDREDLRAPPIGQHDRGLPARRQRHAVVDSLADSLTRSTT